MVVCSSMSVAAVVTPLTAGGTVARAGQHTRPARSYQRRSLDAASKQASGPEIQQRTHRCWCRGCRWRPRCRRRWRRAPGWRTGPGPASPRCGGRPACRACSDAVSARNGRENGAKRPHRACRAGARGGGALQAGARAQQAEARAKLPHMPTEHYTLVARPWLRCGQRRARRKRATQRRAYRLLSRAPALAAQGKVCEPRQPTKVTRCSSAAPGARNSRTPLPAVAAM